MGVELDIANALQAAGLGTVATDIFEGLVRDGADIADAAIFVLKTGGPTALRDLTTENRVYRSEFVDVHVRSDVNARTVGQQTAEAVFQALANTTPAGYVMWLAREPTPIEQDNKGRHRWVVGVQADSHNVQP